MDYTGEGIELLPHTLELFEQYLKTKGNLQRCHVRITGIRQETLHKLTLHLTEVYGCIAIEDLHVKGMMKNARSARSISDMCF
ncbi:MAG: transposase [Oligoflexales bacterium]